MGKNASPIQVTTDIPDIKVVGRRLQQELRRRVREAHLNATDEAKGILMDSIKNAGNFATGKLLRSVTSRFVADKSTDGFSSIIYFKKPGSNYAFYVNSGSVGHGNFPNIANLQAWAKAKGYSHSIYLLARKISIEGIKGSGFMEKATPKIENLFVKRAKESLRILKREFK